MMRTTKQLYGFRNTIHKLLIANKIQNQHHYLHTHRPTVLHNHPPIKKARSPGPGKHAFFCIKKLLLAAENQTGNEDTVFVIFAGL